MNKIDLIEPSGSQNLQKLILYNNCITKKCDGAPSEKYIIMFDGFGMTKLLMIFEKAWITYELSCKQSDIMQTVMIPNSIFFKININGIGCALTINI